MHSIANVILSLLLIAALSGCASIGRNSGTFEELAYPERSNGAELTANQHERLGDGLVERGRPETAYVHYSRALIMLPKGDENTYTLKVKKGLVLLSQGHDEAALKEFQLVLAARPDHPLANEAAGAVYLKAGLNKEARTHLEHAVSLDPELWRAHQFLGVLASRDGNYAAAIHRFTISLELRPSQAGTLNNLGVAQLTNSDYESALISFRQALAAGAPQQKTYNNIGLTLARMGRRQEALQTFRFAGDEAKAYNNLGYVLMLQGDTGRAVTSFEKAIELAPSYYAKAFANLRQARLAESFRASGIGGLEPSSAPAPHPLTVPDATTPTPQPASAPAVQPKPGFTHAQPEPITSLNYTPFQPTTTPKLHLTSTTIRETELAPEVSTPSVPAMTTGTSRPFYGLHVASFQSSKRTNRYVEELLRLGIELMVVDVNLGERGRWHRVLAGRYDSVAEATAARPYLLQVLNLDSAPIQQFEDTDSLTPSQAGIGKLL